MPRRKYAAIATIVDGIRFDSRSEARRWGDLQMLERAGEIRELKRQVPYRIDINGEHVCKVIVDFEYLERQAGAWVKVVEDNKALHLPVSTLKRKLLRAVHGIETRLTGAVAKPKRSLRRKRVV